MSGRVCYTLVSLVLFEEIVAIAACFKSGMVKIERISFELNACFRSAKRPW